jgi:hypothetical protein
MPMPISAAAAVTIALPLMHANRNAKSSTKLFAIREKTNYGGSKAPTLPPIAASDLITLLNHRDMIGEVCKQCHVETAAYTNSKFE